MRYEYEREMHYTIPDFGFYYSDESIKYRQENGWRLVSVIKENEESYYSYWEKPDD